MVIFSNLSYFWFYVLECRIFQTTVVNGDIAVGKELSQSGQVNNVPYLTSHSVSQQRWQSVILALKPWISAGFSRSLQDPYLEGAEDIVIARTDPSAGIRCPTERIYCTQTPLLLGSDHKGPQQYISRKEVEHPKRHKCNFFMLH